MKKLVLFSYVIFFCFTGCVGQNTTDSICPAEGNAQSQRIRDLNKLKNRNKFPEEKDFDNSVSLEKILLPGNDKTRFDVNKAARIKGYVYDVKTGGVETCNCKTKEKDLRDTHIEIVLDPMNQEKAKRFIVEITPRLREMMRKQGINWSTNNLRDKFLGRWVQIEGWLFFDEEHANASENTNPQKENNWRASAWEIHPITKLEVIKRPR